MSRPSLSEALPAPSRILGIRFPADVRADVIRILWLFIALRVALGIYALILFMGNRLPEPCHYELMFDGWTTFPPMDNTGIAFPLLGVWERFDACWYANIAAHGYWIKDSANFWPLFPSLMAFAGSILGGDMTLGGLVVNAVAYVLAMVGLLRLVRLDFNDGVAWRTVLYLSVFPAAFFLFTPYTEPVYLCSAIWAIYAARRRLWLLAGFAALLAGFARYQGMLLVLPVGWEALVYWWESGAPAEGEEDGEPRRRRSDGLTAFFDASEWRVFIARTRTWRPCGLRTLLPPALAVAMPVIAAGLFVAFALSTIGQTPFGAQTIWGGTNFHLPWETVATAWNWAMENHDILEFINVTTLVFFGWLMLLTVFSVPFSYTLFALPQYIIVATRIQPTPLTSTTRLMLVLFPAFVMLAILGRDRRIHQFWLLVSTIMLAYLLGRFLNGEFMA